MLIENLTLYQKNHIYRINHPADDLYYLFDYDERPYRLNMEFQHFHSFYEIMIPLEASAGHLIEGKYYDLQIHDFVLLSPSRLHKTQYHKGNPSKRIIINFRFLPAQFGFPETLTEILSPFSSEIPIYRFDSSRLKALYTKLNEIFNLCDSKSPYKNLLIHSKFLEFLILLLESKDLNTYVPEYTGVSMTDKIYSITSYIQKHYHDTLSLDLVSQKFFISSYYLSHKFKSITGFTLVNYIQMTRIRNAQQLLLSTNEKITVIAESCGFTSFSQFNRVFKKFCGISPSAYRNHGEIIDLQTWEDKN